MSRRALQPLPRAELIIPRPELETFIQQAPAVAGSWARKHSGLPPLFLASGSKQITRLCPMKSDGLAAVCTLPKVVTAVRNRRPGP